MFEVGFGEVVLLFIVALLVLGPEKMPAAIRTAGLWIGRLKRSYNNIRADIEREIGADDIRRQLHNEEVMRSLNSSKEDIARMQQSLQNPLPTTSLTAANTSVETVTAKPDHEQL